MPPKRSCGCRIRLATDADLRGRKGRADGSACEVATFKSWSDGEVKRMPIRRLGDERDGARAIAHACGVDLTVKEHIVGIGLDRRNTIVTVAVGSSHQRSICSFIAHQFIGSVYSRQPTEVVAIVMGHNHPGGDPQASRDDIKTMEKLLCGFQGANILDHVIVSHTEEGLKWFSMRDQYGEAMFKDHCRGVR